MHFGMPAVFDQEYALMENNFLTASSRPSRNAEQAGYLQLCEPPVLFDKRLQSRDINVDAGPHGAGKGNLSQVGSFGR
jgi:hypothetical protein